MSTLGATAGVARRRGRRGAAAAATALRRNPTIAAGAFISGALVLASVLASLLAPHDPNLVDIGNSLAAPSAEHLLGTDQSGRDALSRLLYGGRVSLLGPLVAIAAATIAGTAIGVSAAWRGGWIEATTMRVVEIGFAIPGLLLAILFVTMFGKGLFAPVLAMAVAFTPAVAQLVRTAAVQEKERPYIAAYRVQGWSSVAVCVRRLIPNIMPIVLAQAAINFGYAIMALGAISYLGFGVQAPQSDWGRMISEGQDALVRGETLPSLAPGLCIVLAVVGFSLLGEGIADRIAKRER